MNELIVRPFSRRDQNQAKALILQGLGEHFGCIDHDANPDIDDIEKTFLQAGHAFFVAELDGQAVGTAGLLFESPPSARVVRLSVDSARCRSRIASLLLSACRASAQKNGRRELLASTEPHWENAVRFYLAAGFVQYGRDAVDVHLRMPLAPPSLSEPAPKGANNVQARS